MNRLKQIRLLDNLIKEKTEECKRLYDMATNITSINEGDRVQTSGSGDKVGDTVSMIADLQKEINEQLAEYCELKMSVMKQIDQINNSLAIEVLYKRYFSFKTIVQVADECHISRQWVSKIIKKYYHDFD